MDSYDCVPIPTFDANYILPFSREWIESLCNKELLEAFVFVSSMESVDKTKMMTDVAKEIRKRISERSIK